LWCCFFADALCCKIANFLWLTYIVQKNIPCLFWLLGENLHWFSDFYVCKVGAMWRSTGNHFYHLLFVWNKNKVCQSYWKCKIVQFLKRRHGMHSQKLNSCQGLLLDAIISFIAHTAALPGSADFVSICFCRIYYLYSDLWFYSVRGVGVMQLRWKYRLSQLAVWYFKISFTFLVSMCSGLSVCLFSSVETVSILKLGSHHLSSRVVNRE